MLQVFASIFKRRDAGICLLFQKKRICFTNIRSPSQIVLILGKQFAQTVRASFPLSIATHHFEKGRQMLSGKNDLTFTLKDNPI